MPGVASIIVVQVVVIKSTVQDFKVMFAHKIIEGFEQIIKTTQVLSGAYSQVEDKHLQKLMMEEGKLSNHFDRTLYSDCARRLIGQLEHGQRFYADVKPQGVAPEDFNPDELKLPYEMTSLLFHDDQITEKVCFFCKELSDDSVSTNAIQDAENDFKPLFSLSVAYGCNPEHPELETKKLFEIGNILHLVGVKDGITRVMVREHKFADGYIDTLTGEQKKLLHQGSAMFCSVFLGFLQLMHCHNVFSDSEPAPAKLNKKRKKRGKNPLLEYKVLKMRHGDGRITRVSGELRKGSTKLHHRRGHFGNRWKGIGKEKKLVRVWISPCLVGNADKGEVIKDYRV